MFNIKDWELEETKGEIVYLLKKHFSFENNPTLQNSRYYITDINLSTDTDKNGYLYYINITTHLPGILIGKQGKDINALEKLIKKHITVFKGSIKLNIIENKLWY